MPYDEIAKKATIKYMKENLDDIKFRVKKGKREVYRAQAEKRGMSLQAYIISLIEADMQKD